MLELAAAETGIVEKVDVNRYIHIMRTNMKLWN